MVDGSADRVAGSTRPYKRLTRILFLLGSFTHLSPIHSNPTIMSTDPPPQMSRISQNTLQGILPQIPVMNPGSLADL